jgi:signal transduction histidine kinase
MTVAAAARVRVAALRAVGRRYLGVVDVIVAMALTFGGLAEVAHLVYSAPVAVGATSCVACTGSVAVRRRAPFSAAVIATTSLTVYQLATNDPDGSFIAPAIVLVYYFAGRAAATRARWKWLVALLGYALVANAVIDAGDGKLSPISALAGWPLMVVPAVAGIVVARHSSLVNRLAEATAHLRDEQRIRAARLIGEERNRVARELHDVVAHHVSVMVIQAGGARLVLAEDPVAADQALQVVERSGRGALDDLRRIMGVMRRGDAPDADTAIGLTHLDQIVDRARASGVPVDVQVSGRLDQVPAAVDLVAYRVVQEALTNIVKHARPAAARIVLNVGRQSIDIVVTDTGGDIATPALPGSGQGLIGMRERVALYGGRLSSGPRAGGGFEVRATIPLRTEPLENRERHDERDVTPTPAAATRWLAAAKLRSDLLLAGCWLVALEVDALTDPYRRGSAAINVIAVAVMALAFAIRRRTPLLFLLAVGLAAVPLSSGLTSDHSTLVGFYCVTVPTFTVAAWQSRWPALAGLALWIAGTIGFAILAHEPVAGLAGALVMSGLLWAAGRVWRSQRVIAERLAETNMLLAAERGDRERLAIASERARIARELHTEVAQNVVAMIVQATAARSAIERDPDVAIAAIKAIEQTGREALARMRDILGVLRARQDLLQVRPQPGAGQLHTLIQRLRDSGRAVELRMEGDPTPLPAGVDLTAYRIIEAALTNADPRPSREVTIVLRFSDDRVEVEVSGSGLQLPAQLRLTVRERVALCNGTVLPNGVDRLPRLLVRLPYAAAETLAW